MSEAPRFDADEIRDIIFTWLDLIAVESESNRGGALFKRIAPVVGDLKLAADKSNYLYRRFHLGQQHRKVKCPKHDGHWSGYAFPKRCECSLGTYDITGWLPEPGDETERLGECEAEGCDNEATVEWYMPSRNEHHIYCPEHA